MYAIRSYYEKDLVRSKCQVHGLKHAHSTLDVVLQLKEQQIEFLEKNIQIIENEIIRLTEEDKEFNQRVKNIETIVITSYSIHYTKLDDAGN